MRVHGMLEVGAVLELLLLIEISVVNLLLMMTVML